ncbi:MAG: ABC transporter ATP-binding protein [Anaerolineales bacterium]|nr:ABC transporter ATP-binding protein [Anaerolineales bacterium]
MSQFAVELRDVVKRFPNPGGGEIIAVNHATLQINHGEFFSLLGPSGCGKTTSLRMVAGFEWPTSGEIFIDGKPMGRTPPFLRPVNTVFQSYALFQHMTIFQNVAFGLEMEGVSREETRRRVEAALEMVQLTGMGSRKPRQLSGGQQQRVALARALVKRPAVLLLDEPLGALDLKLRKEMQLELKALQEQVGITFIYVTHDQEEALTMSDRIAVMNKGNVLQIGAPVEIYERPNCRFVADFIGETNFLFGKVKAIDPDFVTVSLHGSERELVGIPLGKFYSGQEVVVSVRPEKMRIFDDTPLKIGVTPNQPNCFPIRIINTMYIGSDTRIVIDFGGGTQLKVWEQNHLSTLDALAYYAPGQELWVTMRPENVLILPQEE